MSVTRPPNHDPEELTTAPGIPGSTLLRFANTLDSVSASEMRQAIEDDCEQLDPADL